MRTLKSTTASTSTAAMVIVDSAGSAPPAATVVMQRSPWHSPVPYLFGGLAAMLGLIAFALLILACSYWKLSGQLNGENNGDDDDDDLESGDHNNNEKKCKDGKGKRSDVYADQFVVIMAGDDKPTCLAMPVVCSKSSAKLFNLSNESCDDVKMAEAVDESFKVDEELRQSDHEEAESVNDSNMNSEESDHHHHHHHQTQVKPAESSSGSS